MKVISMDPLHPHEAENLALRVKGKLDTPSPRISVIERVIHAALEELGGENFAEWCEMNAHQRPGGVPHLSPPATAALTYSPVHVPPWLVDIVTRFVPEDKQAAAIVAFSTAHAGVAL